MQTHFTEDQLRDPGTARANDILRSCVHCGFCTATCPTYQILGDELDSPRGRIYLIKDMLESGRDADERTVKHVDRCLSCLACMTTCPSGVHYMHLVDHARAHIEATYRRPWQDRLLRWVLAKVLPYPLRFRLALAGAVLVRPLGRLLPGERLQALLALVPKKLAPIANSSHPQIFPAIGVQRMRVALLTGCAQSVVNPEINDATIRLLRRMGCEVVVAKGAGCCGALSHHMGRGDESRAHASANVRAWIAEKHGNGLDAIVVNTSGCGTVVKDYGHMLGNTDLAGAAREIASLACDISEVLVRLKPEGQAPENIKVAYHAACSLQHGQHIKSGPKELLRSAGFEVVEPFDGHICCGSAGTYNILQPELATELKRRKVTNLEACAPDVIAAGNLGCMLQIGGGTDIAVVHTVELLDWANGGPRPRALKPAR